MDSGRYGIGVALVLLGLLACDEAPGDRTSSIARLCSRFVAIADDQIVRCSSGFAGEVGDPTDDVVEIYAWRLRPSPNADAVEGYCRSLSENLNAMEENGLIATDLDALRGCLDRLDGATGCPASYYDLARLCPEGFLGCIREGGACSADYECASGLRCPSRCDKCRPAGGRGDACEGSDCDWRAGLTCREGKCIERPSVGEPCWSDCEPGAASTAHRPSTAGAESAVPERSRARRSRRWTRTACATT